jgi:hypothetical protein
MFIVLESAKVPRSFRSAMFLMEQSGYYLNPVTQRKSVCLFMLSVSGIFLFLNSVGASINHRRQLSLS